MKKQMDKEFYKNYRFRVFVGQTQIAFSKISNIQMEEELEEFLVGGINFAPHIAATPSKKGGRLIFEKGIVLVDKDISKWRAGYHITDTIEIFVYDSQTKWVDGANQYAFTKNYAIWGGIITKWELGDLDAMGSQVLIQKFEIAHTGIEMGS